MRPSPRSRSISPGLARACLLMALAPGALFGGEAFTRQFLPQTVDAIFEIYHADPVVGFTYEPGATAYETGREYRALYEINSLGLRDREYDSKAVGVTRVLLVGDSFSVSHGLPIEESLSRQLEAALQSVGRAEGVKTSVEVVNTSVGGYSTYNYWRAYERWREPFQPDVVLVAISPDDYDCSNQYAQHVIESGRRLEAVREGQQPTGTRREGVVRRVRKWLASHSELYVLTRNYLYYSEPAGQVKLWFGARGEEGRHQLEQFVVPESTSTPCANNL